MQNQDIVSVVASSVDSGALLASGSFYEWGNNAQGQLGNGTIGGTSDVPYLVPLPLSATQATEGGDNLTNGSTLVQLSDGSYWSWGADQVGQLGNGSKVNHPTSHRVLRTSRRHVHHSRVRRRGVIRSHRFRCGVCMG